jgi:thioredoxin-like negative regulator of GroEL
MRRMAVAATLPANYLELAADCCCTEMAGRPSLDDVVERLREIHGELEARSAKALEKGPDRRYQSAREMAQDLRRYLQGRADPGTAGPHRRAWKFVRLHPTAATVVVAALVIAAGSVIAWRAEGRNEARRLVADARLALREGVDRQGLEMVDRAIALDPGSIEARLVRAKLLIFDRTRDAAEEAREVLERDPDNVTAHAILAGGALALSSALRLVSIDPGPHIEAVEAAAPDGVEARYLKAMSTRDPAERVELLERVLDLDPGNRLALGNLLRTL